MKNKRGWVYPSIFTVFVLVLVVVTLAAKDAGVDTKTINSTIDSLNWENYSKDIMSSLDRVSIGKPNYIVTIFQIAKKAVDFMGYSIFAVSKLAMEIARDNPDIINYKVLLFIVVVSLLSPVLYPVFIIIVSIILITKEWYQNRKEKKVEVTP